MPIFLTLVIDIYASGTDNLLLSLGLTGCSVVYFITPSMGAYSRHGGTHRKQVTWHMERLKFDVHRKWGSRFDMSLR